MLLCACPCGSAAGRGLAAGSGALLPRAEPLYLRAAQIRLLTLGSTTPRQQLLFSTGKREPGRGAEPTAHLGQLLPEINLRGVY